MNHTAIVSWLFGIGFILLGSSSFAEPLAVEDVLSALGLNEDQIVELAQGRPLSYDLSEGRDDEIAAGIAWYLPVPVAKVTEHLRVDNPDLLDLGVIAHGMMTKNSNVNALSSAFLSQQETGKLLDAEPGRQFNLSSHELDSIKNLKRMHSGKQDKILRRVIEQRYREIIFERFEAYRRGGVDAIAPYARETNVNSKPSTELRQAANESIFLARFAPVLYEAWLNYPKALPSGTDEGFRWVEKDVEGRPATILRHRINSDWNGGVLQLTREFYAPHSYNSSQWITGCLPFRTGTVVFQQVRSFTDQVSGVATQIKHLIGRKLLKNKMLASFERLCEGLGQCR